MTQSLNIVYFAWVRERIGRDNDRIVAPDDVETIEQLLDYLRGLDPVYQGAFENPDKLRFALDQNFVQIHTSLSDAKELAIFPPVTGG